MKRSQADAQKVLRLFELNRYRSFSFEEAHLSLDLQGNKYTLSSVKKELDQLVKKGLLIKNNNNTWQHEKI